MFITKLLTSYNFCFLTALTKIDDNLDLLSSLIRFLNSELEFYKFVEIIIQKEIDITPSEQQIFRQNSLCTKFIVSFLKHVAFGYLKDTIFPTIETIVNSPKGFELNPSKIPKGKKKNCIYIFIYNFFMKFYQFFYEFFNFFFAGEKVEDNVQKVQNVLDKCFNDILLSANNFPAGVGKLLSIVERVVRNKFPSASVKSVGGIIFLRKKNFKNY